MLDEKLESQLRDYFKNMNKKIIMQLSPEEHPHKAELVDMLSRMAGLNDYLELQNDWAEARDGLSFQLLTDDGPAGIVFSGVPGGHEFSSLILAILQLGGSPVKLADSIQDVIRGIDQDLKFEVMVSLSCHNCPEVVQALNSFAVLNPRISTEMIDGGRYPDLVKERGVKGVPSVFLNGEPFADGKIDPGSILEKLLEIVPAPALSDTPTKHYDIAIIGGGPAAVAAAVYAARKGLNVSVIGERVGGQVKDTMAIENLIALHETTGPELSQNMHSLLEHYKVDIIEHVRVDSLEKKENFAIRLNTGRLFTATATIIATGARWRKLGVPGEEENIGKGVAYCPHCDGPFFKGQDVAVVGGGNSGVEAALDLSGIVKSVKIVEFLPELKADQVLQDRVSQTANIEVFKNVVTKEILAGDNGVHALVYEDRDSGKKTQLDLAGVFIQIGLVPNSEFLGDLIERNKFGEIVIDDRCRTNVAGLFACGDVTTTPYKQIITAMGEGAKASLTAFDYLLRHTPVAATAS